MHSMARPLRRKLFALAAAGVAAAGLILAAYAIPSSAANTSNVVWESSAPFATWQQGIFDVYNNEWNTSQAGPQTIWADSYHHWGVESQQADSTSVKTYPSVQENYNNPAISRLRGLWSRFTEAMPSAGFDAEAAYDIWLNDYGIEVMVWVDNHGQLPAGSVIAHVQVYGRNFTVWQSGSHMFTFELSGKQESSGLAHLLVPLSWLVSRGDLSGSDTLTQVDFGWEICSTDGKPMDFTVTRYSLTTRM